MPEIAFQFEENHTRINVSGPLLTAGKLNICLLQLPNDKAAILADSSRPTAIAALRDLLAGAPGQAVGALPDMVPGGAPVLIVLPEYALGSCDWATVDAFVRHSARPLILISGFGAAQGKTILNWAAAAVDGETRRHLSWRQETNPISGPMRVNGGWCWIHEPGGPTHCIVYLKNFLEQAHEAVLLDDLQQGEIILHLSFTDADAFPQICADLIQPAAQNAASSQARVRTVLAPVANDRPALVIGSLLQEDFSVNWSNAIDSLLNVVLADRPAAVALCNIAHDKPKADEDQDRWRSLSGVFAPLKDLAKGQKNLPASRMLKMGGISGAIVRPSNACAAAGAMAWAPYGPVNGDFVWRGNMYCPISADGMALPIVEAPEASAFELERFLRRFPPGAGIAPRLLDGIQQLSARLKAPDPPPSDAILNETLDGVLAKDRRCPELLYEPETAMSLKAGLHALATLKTVGGIEWQGTIGTTGQLRFGPKNRNILVWRAPDGSPALMKRRIGVWRQTLGDHPDLVVFGGTNLGDLADGEIEDDRRDDFTAAPPSDMALGAGGSLEPAARDQAARRGGCRVAGLSLAHVAAVYADYEADEDADRVAALVARIDSCL